MKNHHFSLDVQRFFHSPPGSTGLVVGGLNILERKAKYMDDRLDRGNQHVEASVPDVPSMFLSPRARCEADFPNVSLIAILAG